MKLETYAGGIPYSITLHRFSPHTLLNACCKQVWDCLGLEPYAGGGQALTNGAGNIPLGELGDVWRCYIGRGKRRAAFGRTAEEALRNASLGTRE